MNTILVQSYKTHVYMKTHVHTTQESIVLTQIHAGVCTEKLPNYAHRFFSVSHIQKGVFNYIFRIIWRARRRK